jgi:hypothetical protein
MSEKALGAGATATRCADLATRSNRLPPVAAVLVEHVWAQALDDAVSRTGGRPLASELVDAAALGELSTDLIAVAARGEKRG